MINEDRVKRGIAQAIITNSGCANAATGKEGIRDALIVSGALSRELAIREELILLGSTGVIGKRLPVKKSKAASANWLKGSGKRELKMLKKP